MIRFPLTVELHGSQDSLSGTYDVSEYVVGATWSSSVHAPYENIELELTIPVAVVDRVLPGELVAVGASGARGGTRISHSAYWVVIRDRQERPNREDVALAWGKVDSVTVVRGVDQSSGGHYCEVSITGASWASLLEECRMIVVHAPTRQRIGAPAQSSFLLPDEFMKSYLASIRAILATGTPYSAGRALRTLWRAGLSRGGDVLNLPDSLFADSSDRVPFSEIPVAYASSDYMGGKNLGANVVAPTYSLGDAVPHVPGGVPRGMGGPGGLINQTWWQVLTSMFQVDPSIAELCPVLDVPDYDFSSPGLDQLLDPDGEVDGVLNPRTTLRGAWRDADEALTKSDKGYQKIVAALGGSRPALLYRMKPFATPITLDWMTRWFEERHPTESAAPHIEAIRGMIQVPDAELVNRRLDQDAFASVDPRGLPALAATPNSYQLGPGDIHDFVETASDARVINAVVVYPLTMSGPKGSLAWGAGAPMPVIHWSSPREYGVRLFETTWPFFGGEYGPMQRGAGDYFSGLTEMVYSIVANPGMEPVIHAGSASCVYRPRARAGHWFRIQQDGDRGVFRGHWTGSRLGYAETVTHSVQVGQSGEVTTRTQIVFERLIRMEGDGVVALGAAPIRSQITASPVGFAGFDHA